MAGYDAAAITLPARGVGGDFFVGQPISATRVAFALGDVSGKGMPAGLVASSLQARLEAVALHGGGTAADVVADVNRALCERSEAARFATLAYLELDIASHRLTVVNAGHLPVLCRRRRRRGRVARPRPARPSASCRDAQFDSETQSTLRLVIGGPYSDGVTEAFDPDGREFGDDGLASSICVGSPASRPRRSAAPSRRGTNPYRRRAADRRRDGDGGQTSGSAGVTVMRTLLVDDEQPARDRLRQLLAASDDVEIVGEAEDGVQALERIQELTPDLVMLDIQMPGCSGLEVAASLGRPRPAIVFCTAFDQYAVDAFELHAVDYLLKPVNRARLAGGARPRALEPDARARTRARSRHAPGSTSPRRGSSRARRRDSASCHDRRSSPSRFTRA